MKNNKISSLGLALSALLASTGLAAKAIDSNVNKLQAKVIVNRTITTSNLLLKPSVRTNQVATHYSHMSHQSHRSHSSHSSHYSSRW